MARRSRTKIRPVAFKVGPEMAAFLDALPNRSEYIRAAVLAALHRRCPVCHGAGNLPIGLAAHYAEVLAANPVPGTNSVE